MTQLAIIKFLHPGDPDYPSNALPETPAYPTGGPVPPERPEHTPRPPRPWPPIFPPRPTDPDWGVGGRKWWLLPILIGPGVPLPPVDGGSPPPVDPPPGTIWPPLPPGVEGTTAALLVYIEGVGTRYVVVDLSNSATPPIAPTPEPK
jgi:hypothetical protein